MPELTKEDIKNGWTVEKLEKYLKDREKAQSGVIMFHPDHRKPQRPKWANNLYRPLQWR
jgi:hypothetical protein